MSIAILIMKVLLIIISVVALVVFAGYSSLIAEPEVQLFDLINQVRAEENLTTLTHDSTLYEIALTYCMEMYQEDELTHDGFADRASSVLSIGYTCLGENLARGYTTPEAVKDLVEDWLSSPSHKENILNPQFTYTGLAYYKGCICQIFGGYDSISIP